MFHNEIIAGLKILQLSRHPSDRIDLQIVRSRKRSNSQASSHQLLLGDLDGKLGIALVLLVRLHHLQRSVSLLHSDSHLLRCTWIAFALASSKAVTHFCLSTSEEALKVTTISDSAGKKGRTSEDDPMMVMQQ